MADQEIQSEYLVVYLVFLIELIHLLSLLVAGLRRIGSIAQESFTLLRRLLWFFIFFCLNAIFAMLFLESAIGGTKDILRQSLHLGLEMRVVIFVAFSDEPTLELLP